MQAPNDTQPPTTRPAFVHNLKRTRASTRGSAVIEFAVVAVILIFILLAGIEFNRMLMVYTNIADSSKAGMRYAIVHGSARSSEVASAGDPSLVVNRVKYYLQAIDQSASDSVCDGSSTVRLHICVTYLDSGSNVAGNRVEVLVDYRYDPWIGFPFPRVPLRSVSRGVITW